MLWGVTLPMMGVAGLAIVTAGRFQRPSGQVAWRAAGWVCLGLAGTLPILVSSKQAGHYVVPAVPVYAIAVALILAPTAGRVVERVNDRRWNHRITVASMVIVIGTLAAALVPALGRDRTRLEGLDQLAAEVPYGVTIGTCPAANADWGLHAWFERRFRVSLDARNRPRREWFLQTTATGPECPPSNCRVVTHATGSMVLMRCQGER
jgi:hypothetical protein